MPAGKNRQNNAMLYTTITFVALFIISTTLAVIYYVNAEDHRTKAATLQQQIQELATAAQRKNIGAIVGTKSRGKSYLETMTDYLDDTVYRIIGGVAEDTSAEQKVAEANRKIKELLATLTQEDLEIRVGNGAKGSNASENTEINRIVGLLAAEDFSAVVQTFDENMKTALPIENLEQTWKATIADVGQFKRQIKEQSQQQFGYNTIVATCEFENGYLDIKMAYDNQNQLSGLFLVPVDKNALPNNASISAEAEPEKQISVAIEITDANTIGLIRIIEKLKAKLDNSTNSQLFLNVQLEKLGARFDDAAAAGLEKEKTLLAEKDKYAQQVNEIEQSYNDLKALMEQTSQQQVKTLMTQLDQERSDGKELTQKLLRTQAELKMTEGRMEHVLEKLRAVVPPPDNETSIFRADGKIMLIDENAKIVHLNIGINDHVYPGLTFSVYDRNMPIPKNGEGKAEIEVFDVMKNISAARITKAKKRNPIIPDDIIANLVWDSEKINIFVVAGEFDLNGDGASDYKAAEKVKALIEKWGGKASDSISVDTDFLILGRTPVVRRKPTFDQIEVDPMAMEKYELAIEKLAGYKEIKEQAQKLSVPVFNYERFLYFTGYKTLSSTAGAF